MLISLNFASIFLSFIFTSIFVPLFYKVAHRFKILDIPDGKIKNHKMPTPYLGGIAVFLGFFFTLLFFIKIEKDIFLFLVGLLILLLVGFLDDLYAISPLQKLLGQIFATIVFLFSGFYLKTNFFPFPLNIFISAFWILSINNAFNLVDVMDGLATVLGICATISFMTYAIIFQQAIYVVVLGSLLGALISFLLFNKPLAKIYLGDMGSLFIGGFLAVFPFFIQDGFLQHKYGFLIPLFILIVPTLEIVSLIVIRLYKKIPFYLGSPDHFSIYLQKKSWSKYKILLYVFILSFIQLFVTLLLFYNKIDFWVFLSLEFAFLLFWIFNLVYVFEK